MFQLLAEVTQVNTQGALALLVSTLQLTDGNSLHSWHLIVGFVLKRKCVASGVEESYANIKHTQTPHKTVVGRDINCNYREV